MPEWKVPGYTELRPLGRGGFGDVVLARHDASGILVAIKYLRADLRTDRGFAEAFRREAAVLSSVDDPNVVRLYEYVERRRRRHRHGTRRRRPLREILSARARPPRRRRWSFCRARCSAWPPRTGVAWSTGTTSRRTCWSTATA